MRNSRKGSLYGKLLPVLLILFALLGGCTEADPSEYAKEPETVQTVEGGPQEFQTAEEEGFDAEKIPEYSGEAAVVINGNQPYFTAEDLTTEAFEFYSELDSLGRCGAAYANICEEIMPTEERGAIGQVRPSGWHTVKYNDLIDGNYLYNRCHLIGYQLAGENANEKNLLTGTRCLNTEGMLPYEDQVADYVKETGNHVLYRVTPIYEGDDLVASGVLMEAKSVEDKGKGVCFCVYVYNCQPGIHIDYATGESMRETEYAQSETGATTKPKTQSETKSATKPKTQSETKSTTKPTTQTAGTTTQTAPPETQAAQEVPQTYILNTNTHKFHKPGCRAIKTMSEENKQEVTGTRDSVIADGYEPCKICNP